jgi:hypothetical protein
MKSRIGILAIALMVCLGFATNAHAALTLYLATGALSSTCVDNAGCDLAPLITGDLINSTTLGNFTVISSTGLSKPVIGPPNQIDLNSISVSSTSGGTLTLVLADDGFTPGGANLPFTFNIGGTTQGSVLAQAFVSASNGITNAGGVISLGAVTQIGSNLNFSAPPPNFGGGTAGNATVPSGYAMIEKIVITHTGAATTSFDAHMIQTPEPTSLALLGTVLLGASSLLRKKLRRS